LGFFYIIVFIVNVKLVAKVKSIIDIDKIRLYGSLDSNLNGTNFNNTASQTVFSFGKFVVTSNLEGRRYIDYSNELSSFVRPITLETMELSDVQSEIIYDKAVNAVLNLDKSDLNTFVRYGSAYEFLRNCIETIILNYPGSLFANSKTGTGVYTVNNYKYDSTANTTTFRVPIAYLVNKFGLVYNDGNLTEPDDIKLKNLNLSYEDYIVWSLDYPTGNSFSVIGFTGFTITEPTKENYNNLILKVVGNPFPIVTGTSGSINFHIKPNNKVFEEFRELLDDYQKYIVSERISGATSGFRFKIKEPTLLDDGSIIYSDTYLLWKTADDYNIDIDTANYRNFLDSLLTIGSKYDSIKTDLIARFLTPTSIKTYDLTEEGKMTKLLRLYGWEFDQMREFIDSLVYINHVTYDKINNLPDQLVKNLARTFGWNYFSLINEDELVESFLTIDEDERNLHTDLMPAEIDIELWRRILINTNYFWKSKGTREAIKSMFLLIGIPEPFINITEYVYTVDGKIDPDSVTLTQLDFPSNSLPYDTSGYPVAPEEINSFYFQISGDTDSGQAYMDVFRMAGFNLMQTVDNKKSWIQTGATMRLDDTTPQYYQQDSRLVLNTKEVDISLDTARGIEYDVFDYIKNTDFPANSSGYTLPYKFINISLGVRATQTTFPLPAPYSKAEGELEVRFNGILLNAPREYSGTTGGTYYTTAEADYSIDYTANTFTLLTASAVNNPYRRDVIQATYIYSAMTSPVTGISVQYMVTRIKPNLVGTTIPLPSPASGDVQVTINGIALTKNNGVFTGDYTVNPSNTSEIIISNPEVISYLAVMNQSVTNAYIQVAYVNVIGSTSIAARNEIYKINSFSGGKVYYNSLAGKFVYKLNYKVNDAKEVKILIDGIGLEPGMDYSINVSNPYEIFLPAGLKYGSVISAYYLVGGSDYFTPVIGDTFGVGDISQLSFLEFIELIQRRMINVRNRKTISDFKGGWYPTLLNVYIQYLQRAELDSSNPLQSNGYTFENLYSFLSKYNAFFQRFVDQLLSATIILRKSGLLVRNTVFTKQKFTYKRGVNLYADGSTTIDMRGNAMYQYLGDDGSEFSIPQSEAPAPIVLSLRTITGSSGTYGIGLGYVQSTGGLNISGYTTVTQYGMQYKVNSSGTWLNQPTPLCTIPLIINTYPASITGLTEGCTYNYRAMVISSALTAYGNTLSTIIPFTPPPVPITIETCVGIMSYTGICSTGGIVTPAGCGADVEYYGMMYRAIGTIGEFGDLTLSPTALTFTSAGGSQFITICGDPTNTYSILPYPLPSWINTEAPEPPAPLGVSHRIDVTGNAGVARSTLICYTPTVGTTKCVCVTQAAYVPTSKSVCILCSPGGSGTNYIDEIICACGAFGSSIGGINPSMSPGECFYPTFCWCICKPSTAHAPYVQCVELKRNGITINTKSVSSKAECTCGGTWNTSLLYGDCIEVITYASAQEDTWGGQAKPSRASIHISSIGAGVGSFSIGVSPFSSSITCSNMPLLP
jgi:hypothetical protein